MSLAALLPILQSMTGWSFGLPMHESSTLAAVNFLGWVGVLSLWFARGNLRRNVIGIAQGMGIDARFRSFETLLNIVMTEVNRKNSALLTNLMERKINSKEELSRTLERIVGTAFKLLDADSAELALFDRESGLYHSSFVLGKPFRKSAQAMLSGAMEGTDEDSRTSPDVLVQPVAFSGAMLGSLRVALKKGRLPSLCDREIISLLALQGGLAIINAQYTHELMRMKRVSEESVKVKTGFLANLSHEIRAPLGIMLNAVELVLDGLCGPVNDDQLETLRMVRSNGEHLLELINDVLDYAKIEAGTISPNKTEVVVNDILTDISSVVRSQAEAKRHRLICKNSEEVLTISCDRRHLRQMLINMLTNAVKYTPDGGVIEVWAERIPGNKVRIQVKDSGVGIDPADRSKVFAPFERLQNSYSINQMGAGLGMSLTKRLAEVNGGTIDFDSQPGKGSQFWITFHATEFNPSTVRAEDKTVPEVQGEGEVVLLVEPDDGERAMLTRYLSHVGFNVVGARSKSEALDLFRDKKIELAIVDNNTVDNPQEDMVKVIRDSAGWMSLPIVLVSSRAFVFDIEKYLRAGIDRCLSKPVALKTLGLTCRQLIDESRRGGVREKTAQKDKGTPAQTRVLRADDIYH